MPMRGRPRIRLGDDQPVFRTRQLAHFLAEFDGPAATLVFRQYAETTALHRAQKLPLAAFRELVFAIAEVGEMVVGHPAKQGGAFIPQLGVGALRAVAQQDT
jgi:hypothetical protein